MPHNKSMLNKSMLNKSMFKRVIKSYVLREGRMTPGQTKALKDHWQAFGLNIDDGDIEHPFSSERPLVLEIGFGMGDSLFEMARDQTEYNFVGVEVHRPGVGHLLQLAAANALDNLKVYRADSIDVLNQCMPDHSLDKIQIFFPDPWHKKKHHKRRLIQAKFIALLATKLKPGGILHIATDWAPYAEVIEEAIKEANEQVNGGWYPCEIPLRVETKYERRGLGLNHEVFDLAFKLA